VRSGSIRCPIHVGPEPPRIIKLIISKYYVLTSHSCCRGEKVLQERTSLVPQDLLFVFFHILPHH
jgi:hypothetical protein